MQCSVVRSKYSPDGGRLGIIMKKRTRQQVPRYLNIRDRTIRSQLWELSGMGRFVKSVIRPVTPGLINISDVGVQPRTPHLSTTLRTYHAS